jgi:hypothetical protein
VSKNSSPTEFCYLKIEEARNGDFQEKKILKRIHTLGWMNDSNLVNYFFPVNCGE